MHPEIEKLIDLALADGQITEKERNVIFKKAAELGVDSDEVDMTLDAKLYQIQVEHLRPNKEKNGSIKTCPACGSHIKVFQVKCDDCGYEFRETKSSVNVKEFHQKIITAAQKDRASIIQTFPIPTNKEDIIEFLTLSIPGATPMTQEEQMGYIHPLKGMSEEGSYRLAEISAWENKSNMVIQQTKVLFIGDISMTTIINNYESQLLHNLQKQTNKKKKYIVGLILGILVLGLFIGLMASTESSDEQKEKDKLNNIELQINNAVQDKNYDKALILNEQLVWTWKLDYSESQKMALQYDEKRKSYKATIEKMKIK